MGRWSTLRIQIKGTVISIITAYRACKTPVTLESNTAYAQQWREWAKKTHKKVDPRERTLKDLKAYMKKEIEKKREIVLLIDAN
jgi:fructose/tagatose bisphosphate aldolase